MWFNNILGEIASLLTVTNDTCALSSNLLSRRAWNWFPKAQNSVWWMVRGCHASCGAFFDLSFQSAVRVRLFSFRSHCNGRQRFPIRWWTLCVCAVFPRVFWKSWNNFAALIGDSCKLTKNLRVGWAILCRLLQSKISPWHERYYWRFFWQCTASVKLCIILYQISAAGLRRHTHPRAEI